MELHQPRDSLAVDMEAFELQLASHAPVAIVGRARSQLMQAEDDFVFQVDRRGRAVGLIVESRSGEPDGLARCSHARRLSGSA
jgi:hypothetical protein